MPIPQPGIVGTRADYERGRQASLANATQAAGQYANMRAEKQRLEEEQRQFDIRKEIELADKIRNTQHAGNWANFAQENPGMTKNLFYELYGPDQGEEVYKQLTTGDNQTKEQIINNITRQYLRFGGSTREGGQQPPSVRSEEIRQEEEERGVPQERGAGTTSLPMAPGIPERQTPEAGEGPESMNLAGPAQTERQRVEAPNVQPRSGARAEKVESVGQEQERPQTKQWESDYARKTAGVQISQDGTLINEAGQPVAKGQEDAAYPVNTMTLEQMDTKAPNPDEVGASQTARSIADEFAKRGASEEAREFAAKGTAVLRSADKDSEEWKEFDRKAREYFGVDGDTWFAVRNQMFDNAREGRPLGYMPPENERTQWWWTGQDMPVGEKARRIMENPEATADDKRDVAAEISQSDTSKFTMEQLNEVGAYLNNADREMVQSIAQEESVAKDVVKKIGLPESASGSLQKWADAFAKGQGKGGTQKANLDNPRGAKVANRIVQRGANESRKARARLGNRSERQKEKDREAVAEGDFTFAQKVGVTRERAQQIYEEMSGPASERSTEVQRSIPLEERQFEEAVRQFDESMAFEREQAPTEAERKARTKQAQAQAKLMSAQAALKELEADITKEQYEAAKEGGAPQDLTVAYKLSKEIFTRYMEDIHDDCDSQECVSRQLEEALKNDQFKQAYDTVVNINSAISGVPAETVQASLRQRNWLGRWFGSKGGRSAEAEIPVLNAGAPPTRGAPSPTVSSGNQGSAGAALGSQYSPNQ